MSFRGDGDEGEVTGESPAPAGGTAVEEARAVSEGASPTASSPVDQRPRRFVLLGTPNSGKSTLFNRMTGARSRIANFPGVTVDAIEGQLRLPSGEATLTDLPGTYTLDPLSPDEAIALRVLRGEVDDAPDGVVVVADATTLRRSLGLVLEVLGTGVPALVVLTMMDELATRGGSVSTAELSRLLGAPVVGVVASHGVGIDIVLDLLERPETWERPRTPPPMTAEDRFARADLLVAACVKEPRTSGNPTDRIDRVLLHPVAGFAIFLAVMFFFFQAMFTWTAPLMDLLEAGCEGLGSLVSAVLPDGFVRSLLVDGIIAGVGGVIVFVPQIALILLLINVLEGVGYMARAAFAIDRFMGWMGLEGRCFVALLSSYACAIPGIMATRTVPDPKSRLATILVAPFMTCSARLPVYTLLIAGFVPATVVVGLFDLRGLVFFGLYLLGAFSAVAAAFLFKKVLLRGPSIPYVMELPPYRIPRPQVVLRQTWWGIRGFLRKAGTVILAASVILWVLLTFPGVEAPATATESEANALALEGSYAAQLGKGMEPVLAPLGFDWKIGVGLIGSLAAREVVVATLAQIYSFTGDEDDTAGLAERMSRETHADTGEPVYGLGTVLALLVFFVYALQCVSTLAVIRRETNSLFWPAFAFSFMLALAYGAAWVVKGVAG